jgi:hypothetical protein
MGGLANMHGTSRPVSKLDLDNKGLCYMLCSGAITTYSTGSEKVDRGYGLNGYVRHNELTTIQPTC